MRIQKRSCRPWKSLAVVSDPLCGNEEVWKVSCAEKAVIEWGDQRVLKGTFQDVRFAFMADR